MDNTDYVSYETARKLKECGFNWATHNGYSQKMRIEPVVSFGEIKKVHCKTPKNFNDNRKGISKGLEFCSAPSLWEAQKWMREKKNWHIIIEPRIWEQQVYDFKLWHIYRGYENANRGFDFLSYEAALSAGISAALELIGKEEK